LATPLHVHLWYAVVSCGQILFHTEEGACDMAIKLLVTQGLVSHVIQS